MLKKILSLFGGAEKVTLAVDSQGNKSSLDLKTAVAILLLEASGTDDDYAPEEIKSAYKILEKHFAINNAEAEKILEQADVHRKDKEQLNKFVKILNQNFSTSQRQLVFALIWKIICADNQVTKEEGRIAVQFATRLQLSEEQAEMAKKLVFTA